MRRTLHLGRIAGIALRLDWTVAIIGVLIVTNLALGLFPYWHDDWSSATIWTTAIAAAVVFFASILAHELAHALVAIHYKVPVRTITLFLFGGVTDIEREPVSPRAEALMALAGPLMSVVIGVVAILFTSTFVSRAALDADTPSLVYASLSPTGTVLAWLGPLNIFLAIFNMLPGYPLDGGRVLRAALWAATRDLHKATRWAAAAGIGIGWLLAIAGIIMTFGSLWRFGAGVGQGLWLAMIGWFLSSAAASSYRRTVLQSLLEDVHVDQLMHTITPAVATDATIRDLVSNVFLGGERSTVPVARDGVIVGLVGLDSVRAVARAQWDELRAADVMIPLERLPQARPEQDAYEAFERLERAHTSALPVVADGRILGTIDRQDIGRWLTLMEPGGAP